MAVVVYVTLITRLSVAHSFQLNNMFGPKGRHGGGKKIKYTVLSGN